MTAGSGDNQPSRGDVLILLGLAAILLALLAIWTAPVPTSSKAGLSAVVFVAAFLVVYAGGRR